MDSSGNVGETEVERLKRQLAEKQREVDDLKGVLLEKDRTIAELGSQIGSLRVAAIQQQTNAFRRPELGTATPNVQGQEGLSETASFKSNSSSEDEM
jgi:predicted RNase H-like nuclease (RuvC/YqgF family)